MGLCQNTSTPAHQPALYKLQTIVKCSHRSLGGGSTADTIASHPPHSTFDGILQRRCIKTYLSNIILDIDQKLAQCPSSPSPPLLLQLN